MYRAYDTDPATLHAQAAALDNQRTAWADHATTAGDASATNAKALVQGLAAISAAKPKLATFHTTPDGVSVAWQIDGGTIVRPLRGLSGQLAGAISLTGDALAMLATMAAKLHADGLSDLHLHSRTKEGRAWVEACQYSGMDAAQLTQWKADGCPPLTLIKRAPLTIKAGRFTATLNAARESAVAIAADDIAWTIPTVDAAAFRAALASTLAVAKTAAETRPCRQAVHLCTDDAGLYLQATDGHRLHTARVPSRCDPVNGLGPARDHGHVLTIAQATALAGQIKAATALKIGARKGGKALAFATDGGPVMTFDRPDIVDAALNVRARFDTCHATGESVEFTCTAKDLKAALAAVIAGKAVDRGRTVRLHASHGLLTLQSSARLDHGANPRESGERMDNGHECPAVVSGFGVVALNAAYLQGALAQTRPGDLVTVQMFAHSVAVFSPGHAATIMTVRDPSQLAPVGENRSALDTARDHAAAWAWQHRDYGAAPKVERPNPDQPQSPISPEDDVFYFIRGIKDDGAPGWLGSAPDLAAAITAACAVTHRRKGLHVVAQGLFGPPVLMWVATQSAPVAAIAPRRRIPARFAGASRVAVLLAA